jgi:hypothetical protein
VRKPHGNDVDEPIDPDVTGSLSARAAAAVAIGGVAAAEATASTLAIIVGADTGMANRSDRTGFDDKKGRYRDRRMVRPLSVDYGAGARDPATLIDFGLHDGRYRRATTLSTHH